MNKTSSRKKRSYFVFVTFCAGFVAMETALLFSGWVGNYALRWQNPSTSAFIQDFEFRTHQRVTLYWKKLDRISTHLKKAVVVSEDDAFFEHAGIDLKELRASWETDWKSKKISRGGSTITMQLVKNLYLNSRKSPLRKINEIILALDLEKKVSKGRILEVYLNIAEWGPGIFGAEAASRHYFGKSAGEISAEEAAFLAAILPNPLYLSSAGSYRAQQRKAVILERMSHRSLPEID